MSGRKIHLPPGGRYAPSALERTINSELLLIFIIREDFIEGAGGAVFGAGLLAGGDELLVGAGGYVALGILVFRDGLQLRL